MSELDKDIQEEYAKHGSLYKTAKAFHVTVDYVHNVVENSVVEEKPDLSTCVWDGFGDPTKKKHLVARNLAKLSWDNDNVDVAAARVRYELGTHGLNIGRDGPWLLMYSFPRAVVSPRPNYFQPTLEA